MPKSKLQTPWVNISDMMSGLMMVFLLISVTYSSQVKSQAEELEEVNKKVQDISASYTNNKEKIYERLNTQFSHKFSDWNAELDRETLTLRFKNPSVLFEPGSDKITSEFETILEELWAGYVDILQDYPEDVTEVKIEGHTSSEWESATLDESYFNNMKLSQERTRSVLKHCYGVTSPAQREWVRDYVTANGMSFSKPVLNENGTENSIMSRRVEFTVVVSSRLVLEKIGEALQ